MTITENVTRLAPMVSMAAFNGHAALLAVAGIFKLEWASLLLVAFGLLAGPGAISIAMLFDGPVLERTAAALIAGLLATSALIAAAGLGPKLIGFFDIKMLQIFGGIAVVLIGFIVMQIKIPAKVPVIIMLIGLVLAVISGIIKGLHP